MRSLEVVRSAATTKAVRRRRWAGSFRSGPGCCWWDTEASCSFSPRAPTTDRLLRREGPAGAGARTRPSVRKPVHRVDLRQIGHQRGQPGGRFRPARSGGLRGVLALDPRGRRGDRGAPAARRELAAGVALEPLRARRGRGSGPYYAGALVFTALTLGYTLKGGLRTSIWTDAIHAGVFAAMLVLVVGVAIPGAGPGTVPAILGSGSWTLVGGVDLLLVALPLVRPCGRFSWPAAPAVWPSSSSAPSASSPSSGASPCRTMLPAWWRRRWERGCWSS